MSKKRIKWTDEAITLEKAFDAFVASQMAKGIKEKTVKSYRFLKVFSHFINDSGRTYYLNRTPKG